MRIDKRTVWTVLVVVATLLQLGTAGAVRFVRDDARKALDAEQQRAVALQRQLESQQERAASVDEQAPEPTRWRLLDGPDVAATMEAINALGVEAHVTFDVIKAATSNVAGKQTFQLSGHGTATQVCEFLAAIEQHTRLIVVESGRMMPGGDEQIAFDLGLATYHRGGAR